MRRQATGWSSRPAAAKVGAASSVLVLIVLGVVALDPVYSETGGTALAVFTKDGPVAQFATIYELRDEGILEIQPPCGRGWD